MPKMIRPAHRVAAPSLTQPIAEARALLARGEIAAAMALAEALAERHTNHPDLLRLQLDLAIEAEDELAVEALSGALLGATPSDAALLLRRAKVRVALGRPFLARRDLQAAIAAAPQHPGVGEVRELLALLDATTASILAGEGLTGTDGEAVALLFDEMVAANDNDELDRAWELGQKVLRRAPQFGGALLPIAAVAEQRGDTREVVRLTQRRLALLPGDVRALALLARAQLLGGELVAAQLAKEQLLAASAATPDETMLIIETLAYFGDDQALLDRFEPAARRRQIAKMAEPAVVYHLAAVAALRQGRADAAKRYWKRSFEYDPAFADALSQRDDLTLPPGERHAPWYLEIQGWLSAATLQRLTRAVVQVGEDPSAREAARAIGQFLRASPSIVPLLPLLLERGGPGARGLALSIIASSQRADLAAIARDFGLGPWGPDAMRLQAIDIALSAGLLPRNQMITIYRDGRQQPMLLLSFTLDETLGYQHRPAVQQLLAPAIELLNQSDPNAEQLLRAALALEPDAPDIQNNLALALELAGRPDESQALIAQIVEQHPTYLFARASLALQAIGRQDYAAAEAVLAPIVARERLHPAELRTLARVQVSLLLAQQRDAEAESWLDLWEGELGEDEDSQRLRISLNISQMLLRRWPQQGETSPPDVAMREA